MNVFFGITTRTFHYDRTVGRFESTGGAGLTQPVDMALSGDGKLYVVNRGQEWRPGAVRVTMMTLDEDFLGQCSTSGEGDGEAIWPSSVALDSNQNLYMADEWLNRISIFDKDGLFLDKWGVPGSGDGELNRPGCIRFDKEDNMYLVDSCNNRIQVFTKEGKFLSKWGGPGNGEGQFNLPWGLCFDSRGDVYVADWRNDRIQKFTADGQYLAEFGSSGNRAGEFNRPISVAVDKHGDIYVADWSNDRVQVLTPDGRFITAFTGDGGLGKWGDDKLHVNWEMVISRGLVRDLKDERALWHPMTLLIDDEGRVLIIDSDHHRIQVYQKDNY